MHLNKKFLGLGLLLAIILAAITFGIAGAASATGDHNPEVNGKPVTVCHATGSNTNPYVKLDNVPLVQFLGNNGHATHEGDIWAPFSYVQRDNSETWHTVNVAGQGDQSLLAFEDCQQPKEDTPVTIPDVVYNDACGTSNDNFSVAPGAGYTLGSAQQQGANQSITATLNEGFVWADDTTGPKTFTRPAFTDVDCGLPDTGSPQIATTAGWTAVGGLAVLAILAATAGVRSRRENS